MSVEGWCRDSKGGVSDSVRMCAVSGGPEQTVGEGLEVSLEAEGDVGGRSCFGKTETEGGQKESRAPNEDGRKVAVWSELWE